MAAKSTPSLFMAIKNDSKSRTTVKVNMNMFNTQLGASTNVNSELDSLTFEKPAKNLNVMSSHEDLEYQDLVIGSKPVKPVKEKARPMTTKFGDRRQTLQPKMFQVDQNNTGQQMACDVKGILERHMSP